MLGKSSPAAAWFDDPELADVRINICTSPTDLQPTKKAKTAAGAQESTATAAAPARSFRCHAVILSIFSGYFKAQLSSAWQQTQEATAASGSTGPMRTVNIHVEPDELDAMHELLRMMYSQALPAAGPSVPLFLQCLRLADRFQAASCMQLLLTELASVPSDDVDDAMLGYVFQASPGVVTSPSYPALLASATKALLRLFGDVPEVIRDEELMQQFLSLPHEAVLAWAKSDDLWVHSENCVVFLISTWVKANQDSTAAQHEELAHQIRVFHVGPAYLHHILPSLTWFKGCSGMRHLAAVRCCKSAGITMKEGRPKEEHRFGKDGMACPPAWLAKPRHLYSSSQDASCCGWVVSADQLNELASGACQALSPPVYVNGFLMRIDLEQSRDEEALDASEEHASMVMGVRCGIDISPMKLRGLPVPDDAMFPVRSVLVNLGSSASQLSMQEHLVLPSVLEFDYTWGLSDFFGRGAPTLLELLAPYLQEGQLHVQAIFNGVDEVLQA